MDEWNIIEITATLRTPTVKLNGDTNELFIQGRCIPDLPVDFFHPLTDDILSYLNYLRATKRYQKDRFVVNIHLEYINMSSLKHLISLFRQMQKLIDIKINWFCNKWDTDMIETGEDIKSILEIPVKVITV